MSDKQKTTKENREKRAQAIAAMGMVTREGERFRVQTPGLRSRSISYFVWRDESAKVRCDCLEFEETFASDKTFRCEHILAVKFSLLSKPPSLEKPQTTTSEAKKIREELMRKKWVIVVRQALAKQDKADLDELILWANSFVEKEFANG